MFGPPEHGARPGSLIVSGVPAIEVAPGLHNLEMADGRIIAISHQPMADGGWVDTFEDVSERHRAEANLERMARYDGLTKLPNRTFFRERLEEALDKARACGPVVLCLDLDGFKAVNDTLGHMIGDGLLRAVAQRLLDCVRTTDVVGRLGGDEFAIIQAEAGSAAESEGLAKRIIESLSTVFDIETFQVAISVSIGIAREDAPTADALAERATTLLKNADVALYRAKVEGRSTFRFFAAEMDRKLQARRLLELDLRSALERGQFELVFQPLVDAGRGAVCCFEALLRWNHPVRGLVSPVEFIPVAEETGLIKAIGRWVLQRACTEAAGWPADVKVAVNLSPVQFNNPFLAAEVVKALDISGLDPRRLELEITESVLIMEDAVVLTTLHQIRDLGVRIALDDFGTGYSSLSYLRRFPFDKIKIDRSFVNDLAVEDNVAIVRAILGLGHALKMAVVAEGVETIEQQIVLVGEGCTELQGYYFSPPRSAGHVRGLIDGLRTALPRCA
jgi:diguanylate cyclase (GGDEF)-like protein